MTRQHSILYDIAYRRKDFAGGDTPGGKMDAFSTPPVGRLIKIKPLVPKDS
jgi:hypothetical protein